MATRHVRNAVAASALLFLLPTCVQRPALHAPAFIASRADSRTKFHMRDGTLFVLDSYVIHDDTIVGTGAEFNADRVEQRTGQLQFARFDVALVETTQLVADPGVAALAVMSVLSVGITVACLSAPKACFGSCPTFYVPDGNDWRLQAEGFSTSIARSLEADDIDSLADARPHDGTLTLAMRNEALETHIVRRVSLLVVDGPANTTVLRRPDNRFAAVGPSEPPSNCTGTPDGCALIEARDGHEFTPGSDGRDLAARSEMVLQFASAGTRDVGIVLTLRNSLMSTFVFYHLIALEGRHYGDFLAAIERHDIGLLHALNSFERTLGDVEVSVRQGGADWRSVGAIGYVGPIAQGVRVVPARLDHADAPYEVRLSFARAHWRFDAVRAGPLVANDLEATEVWPEVADAGRFETHAITAAIHGEGDGLVTQPGDEVRFRFAIPASSRAQGFFLHSRGYYHEWMRGAWLREENVSMARTLLGDPREALRTLAPQFREFEPRMDAIFEASRFTRQGTR